MTVQGHAAMLQRGMREHALALQVERRIYLLRSEKVMLAPDLAQLYGVSTSAPIRQFAATERAFPQISCSS